MISASRLNASSHDCRSAWVKSGGTARSRRWVQQRQHRCAVDRAAECAVQQGVHREVVQRPELHDVRAAGPPHVHQRRRCTREVGHGGLQVPPGRPRGAVRAGSASCDRAGARRPTPPRGPRPGRPGRGRSAPGRAAPPGRWAPPAATRGPGRSTRVSSSRASRDLPTPGAPVTRTTSTPASTAGAPRRGRTEPKRAALRRGGCRRTGSRGTPRCPRGRPRGRSPECLTPPNGAAGFDTTPWLMPTIPVSSRSASGE